MSRDNALWQQCWRDKQTDFHQTTVNGQLVRLWPLLDLPAGARVFVPLCGKSLDLTWLARQGHTVIGVELSPIAVRAYFKEQALEPKRQQVGRLTRWYNGPISILCGDFFELRAQDLGEVAASFDRAALTALPEDLRPAYVRHLEKVLSPGCKTLLLTTEEPEEGETPDPTPGAEIVQLYGARQHIRLTEVEYTLEPNPDPTRTEPIRVEYKAYVLTPKTP